MNDASELILEMSETELRAVLLQLAGGARGRDVQDTAVAEIRAVLERTRTRLGPEG